ncbi:hypothetical protein ACFOKF_25425 [Sphingobium rhizovicinum]|uniref:Uncharacterized protein n=1 Tax=Sphingobium rhizovicinum TaxID=432308 RepID=A0ABV7NN15_9SPHN
MGQDLTAALADAADGVGQCDAAGWAGYPGSAIPQDCCGPDFWVTDIVYFPLENAIAA